MRGGLIAISALSALLIGGVAEADTLRDALLRVYNGNPTITGQRAQLRSLDEGAAIARAGLRPRVSANVGVNQDALNTSRGSLGRNFSAGIEVSYPLFDAGRVRNQINAADTRVQAGRATLRAVEGDIFTETVAVYMDVIRDRSIVTLTENQVRVLEANLKASRDRFSVGDLTRTDVAQSEARLSLAQSNLALAQGRLSASEENYRRIVGDLPADLQPPPRLPPLPTTPEEAVEIAVAKNPDLIAIQQQARAARFDVSSARADRLPTLDAVSSGRYINALGRADEVAGVPEGTLQNSTTAVGIGVQARIPIYQGGVVAGRVRQAQAVQAQILEQGIEVERAVVANTRAAFASYRASLEAIRSQEIAVAANNLALDGTRAEQAIGTRNILDVLNAEQELLNSQVALVSARRDAYVAGFTLLNAMGQAEADDLNVDVGGPLYDPGVNFRRSVRRSSDWGDSITPKPVATRTVAVLLPESGQKQAVSLVDTAASTVEASSVQDSGKQRLAPEAAEPQNMAAATNAVRSEPAQSPAMAQAAPALEGAGNALAQPAAITLTSASAAGLLTDDAPTQIKPGAVSGQSPASLQSASAASIAQKTAVRGDIAPGEERETVAATAAKSPMPEAAAGRVADLALAGGKDRYVVRLGPFRNAKQAEKAGARVQRDHGIKGTEPLSTTITRRGTYHRLAVAGFVDKAKAKRVCSSFSGVRWSCSVRNVGNSKASTRPKGGIFAAVIHYLFK